MTLSFFTPTKTRFGFFLSLVFCTVFIFKGSAQLWSLDAGLGKVAPRSQNLGEIQNISTSSLRLAYAWLTEAPAFGHPDLGFSLHYQNYNSTGIGNSVSAFAFAQRRFSLWNSPLALEAYFGVGPIYVQEVFDIDANFSSQTVSSHLNLGAELGLGLSYKFSEAWRFRAGASFFHASNLGIVKPNYGLNVPAYTIGLSYQAKTPKATQKLQILSPENRAKNEWLFYYNAAIRQIAYNDPAHYVHNFNFEYSRKITALLNVTGGLSFFQDGVGNELEKYAPELYKPEEYSAFSLDYLALGPYLGLELYFGNLSAFGQMGYYLYHPHSKAIDNPATPQVLRNYINYYNEFFIFNRLGLRYRLGRHWLVSLSGKTQLFKVQYLELGLGFRL